MWKIKTLFIAATLFVVATARNDKTYGLTTIDDLRASLFNLLDKLYEDMLDNQANQIPASTQPSPDSPDVNLIRGFEQFGDEIDQQYPHDITYGLEPLQNVWIWARSYAELRSVYALYQNFRRFQRLQTGIGRHPSPKQAWVDLAETILEDPKTGIEQSLQKLHGFVIEDKLFNKALQESEGDLRCEIQQSPNQLIYNLYNSVALTELKGYAMMQFSWMLLKLYDRGNFTHEAAIMRNRYEQRTQATVDAVKRTMKKAKRELWRCDPKKHVSGETYVEVTQLLQGYIQNEVDLNPNQACWETCSEYQYTKSHGCFKNQWCRQQRKCNGKIVGCHFIDSDMWICPADTSTGRRYEYVEYENGRVLGRKTGCKRGTTKVDSWWRYLFWHCSYCMCYCDEQGVHSDRYFNLRSVMSDINSNKVVTGLRFVKENRIIHLQIQEGTLLPRGNIDLDSVHWKPVENYKITDKNVRNNMDYFTMMYEERSMDLDDITVDENHILTGVRFRKVGGHLNFEIQSTPFNFTSGQLSDPMLKSLWKSNDNTDVMASNPRIRHRLITPDIPIRSPQPSIPDSKNDTYIEFTYSDQDRDASQTTVPFLDAQPVTPQIPMALSGAGIFHKGREGFGGFVAPKIYTYDYGKHLQVAIPPSDDSVN